MRVGRRKQEERNYSPLAPLGSPYFLVARSVDDCNRAVLMHLHLHVNSAHWGQIYHVGYSPFSMQDRCIQHGLLQTVLIDTCTRPFPCCNIVVSPWSKQADALKLVISMHVSRRHADPESFPNQACEGSVFIALDTSHIQQVAERQRSSS